MFAGLVETIGNIVSGNLHFMGATPDFSESFNANNDTCLTVNSVDDKLFEINVIPYTFEVTTFADLGIGDKFHIKVDLIARYLERFLSGTASVKPNVSQSFFAAHGFA